jgi:hypothetical protein
MATLDTLTALSPDAFARMIADGPLEIAPSFTALVDVDPQDERMLRLSLDRTCTGWFSIARSLVASLTPKAVETCDDHHHLLARVQLHGGEDEPARSLVRLLARQQELFARLHALAAAPASRVSAGCQACIDRCNGMLGYEDFIDCGTECMLDQCRPGH